ncbi:MAG TPA: hypothetical protein ACFYD4_15145 [Candidatus Wunengus sp. YC61]|uniref:hypothetical protein n=1 Tax=Candidatus Wunengus sp. YC61 TaxID=3367698 RepID=UPI004024DC98
MTGFNGNQRENIEVALERKDLAVMEEMQDGEKILLGSLNSYPKETLNLILKKGKISAKEFSAIMKLDIQEFQSFVILL